MRRFQNLRCWALAMVLVLNIICEPVLAKNKGEGSFWSEYNKKKQHKKMMKAAVPLMTLLGSLGWAAHQQHHPPQPSTPPPHPPASKTVIIHVPKPVPVPVPVPVYHYNVERHHHHKQKPKFIYLKTKKKSSRKKTPIFAYYSVPSEPEVFFSVPPHTSDPPGFFFEDDWPSNDLQATLSSQIALLNSPRALGDNGEFFVDAESSFAKTEGLTQSHTGNRGVVARRTERADRGGYYYETDN